MRKVILFLIILIIIGAIETNRPENQQEERKQEIANCKQMDGNPKIIYCGGKSNMICKVECFIED